MSLLLDGWCDWHFAPLLDGSRAVVWDDLPMPFAPILEVVSSFKTIRRRAAVFECQLACMGLPLAGARTATTGLVPSAPRSV